MGDFDIQDLSESAFDLAKTVIERYEGTVAAIDSVEYTDCLTKDFRIADATQYHITFVIY